MHIQKPQTHFLPVALVATISILGAIGSVMEKGGEMIATCMERIDGLLPVTFQGDPVAYAQMAMVAIGGLTAMWLLAVLVRDLRHQATGD